MPRQLLSVDDDLGLHQQVSSILGHPGYACRFVSRGHEAVTCLEKETVDAVLMELGLPDGDGVDLIRNISSRWPNLPILVLTGDAAEPRILAAIRAGAQGYLLKHDLEKRLPTAIEEMLAGGSPLSASAARVMVRCVREPHQKVEEAKLSKRERAVLDCLSRGLTYEESGRALGISVNTVRTHVRRLYSKLDVNTKVEAALFHSK
jgi:DNA-binding NarL/FixJ family response regulator